MIITIRQQGSGFNSSFYFTGITSGSFYINTALLYFSDFVLVLKDGNTLVNPTGSPSKVAWAWFLLGDNSSISCPTGFSLCGAWSMWGNPNGNGNRLDISHMSLYGTGTGGQLPAPGTLFLLGAGLIGLAAVARKKGWNRKSVPGTYPGSIEGETELGS